MKTKTINIQTVSGIEKSEVVDEFECIGRKFVVSRDFTDRKYHVVTDFLTGCKIGDPEYGIQKVKKKTIPLIEANKNFDYSKYTTINHENQT